MKTTVVVMRNILGTASLLMAAYVIARSISDIKRYVKISTM